MNNNDNLNVDIDNNLNNNNLHDLNLLAGNTDDIIDDTIDENIDDNISEYSLDEESMNLIYKSSLMDINYDVDQNEKKKKIKVPKEKNVVDIKTNKNKVNNRKFNPRLPPYNSIK